MRLSGTRTRNHFERIVDLTGLGAIILGLALLAYGLFLQLEDDRGPPPSPPVHFIEH